MSLIKNMKLRSKMLLGFSFSILLMLIALGAGIFGLWSSHEELKVLTEINMEANIASRLEQELLAAQAVFQKYLVEGDTDSYYKFTEHEELMTKLLSDLQSMSTSRERKEYIENIETAMRRYSSGFQKYQDENRQKNTYYTAVTKNGNEMIDALLSMADTAMRSSDVDVQYNVGRAHESLLLGRLSNMKFITFHEDGYYSDYKSAFSDTKTAVNALKKLENNSTYRVDYYMVQRNLDDYQSDMIKMYDLIKSMDVEIEVMKEKENEITSNIEKLNTDILEQQEDLKGKVALQSSLLTSVATGMAVVAIIVVVMISTWILRLVLVPIESLRETFESISKGDVDLEFRLNDQYSDEIGLMSRSFNVFMVNLKKMMDDINYKNWLKTAQNDLNEVNMKYDKILELSRGVLSHLCHYINAQVGTLYLVNNEENSLELKATYAYTNRKGYKDSIKIGEGLVGQSALEKSAFIISDLPEDYMPIQSGLGEDQPRNIIVLPCVHEDNLEAVIEIGSMDRFGDTELNLLKSLSNSIAQALHTASVRSKMKTLLDKTITQSEELQMQQEELRQSNEELEEQTRALKESEQRLQAQQEELRVSNEELEQRTKQLEIQKKALDDNNKELLRKQQEIIEKAEALELANTYKSEFLANMSHELRTPLNSILVLSQLLSDRLNVEALTDKELEFARTINSSGTDLLTLINDILDLSKVEAGRLEVHNDTVKFEKLLQDIIRMFKPVADDKNITFETHLDSNLPDSIVTDEVRLQQIMKNFLSNAIKFTDDGQVVLTIRKPSVFECDTLQCDKDKFVSIEVSDSGIGIPDEKQQIIFEAFRQMDGTTSRKYGGTGLGLTITRELAALLGGHILLESQQGQGSKFVFVLPLSAEDKDSLQSGINSATIVRNGSMKDDFVLDKSEAIKIEKVEAENRVEAVEKNILENTSHEGVHTLLIIEDDKNFSAILASLAEEKGFVCRVANDGQTGFDIAMETNPAAIILDLGLPDIDGMDLAKKFERHPETRHIPIHIISGTDENVSSLLPSSVIGFLQKPVDIKTIYKTLAKIESVSANELKKLLIIGSCGGESFEQFTSLGQVEVHKVISAQEGIKELENGNFECVIIDIEIDGIQIESYFETLVSRFGNIPIILYSESEISEEKLQNLSQYTDNIILKSPKSEERLLDEVSLFLHGMSEGISQQNLVGAIRKTVLMDEMKSKVENDNKFSGKQILVVDDDERNVFALTNVLMQHGFEVLVARNGIESIDVVKSEAQVDLILMDVMMPKMDGYEAIAEIRKLPEGKKIPIISLTAKAMKDDRDKCIQAGANDYMTKPIDIENLLSLLRVWLS